MRNKMACKRRWWLILCAVAVLVCVAKGSKSSTEHQCDRCVWEFTVFIPLHWWSNDVSPSSFFLLVFFFSTFGFDRNCFVRCKGNVEINAQTHYDLHNGKCFDAYRIHMPQPTQRHQQLVYVFFVNHHHAVDTWCVYVDVWMCNRI